MTTTKVRSVIGERVRRLRLERRLTQARLARELSISQGYLSELERGEGSFTAEQLLTILRFFNVPVDYFAPKAFPAEDQLQNSLARLGASHLAENERILPSDRLRAAIDAIRETLVSADSARQLAAIAPVLVNHAGQVNLTRLRNELAELGLERRLGWAIDSTLEALRLESAQVLSREWRLKYRRAGVIIESFFAPWRTVPGPTEDPRVPPQYDVLDPEITSEERRREVIENLSPIALRWRIATAIEVDDFVRALRAARGAD